MDFALRWLEQAELDASRRQDGLTTSERQELAGPRRENEGFPDHLSNHCKLLIINELLLYPATASDFSC